jgi:hypothetical protein
MKSQQFMPSTTSSMVSPEYAEALKVLSEETMSRACDLLLSERDYMDTTKSEGGEQDSSATTTASPTKNGKSDLEQLHDLLKLCRQSAKIIEKEAASMNTTTTPVVQIPAMPQNPAAARERISTQQSLPRTQVKPPLLAKNILPRTMARHHPTNALKRSHFERQPDSISKRPRSNSATTTEMMGGANATSAHSATVAKPPPSALHFLAKLNKDSTNNATTPTTSSASNDNKNMINTDKKKKATTTDKAELPPESPAKRKLPPRSSRK